MKKVYYIDPPQKCDLCCIPITTKFYDARLSVGSWGNVCPNCYRRFGHGTGLGQEYTKQRDGRFLKTKG